MKIFKLFIFLLLFFLICSISINATEKTYQLNKIGKVIITDTFKLSLNSVRWDNGDEYIQPDPNKKWLTLDCTIQNISNDTVSFSSLLMLALFDIDGYSQKMTIFAITKGSVDGLIAPSQIMRGEVAYEVDASQSYWEFVFKPDLLIPNQYFYSIKKEQVK